MARPRDPRRDEAKQAWLDNDGEIKLVDLAEQFEVTSSTMRKWKATDKWDDELKGSAPKQSNKSAPIKKQSKTAVKKEPVESELVVSDDNELTDKQRLFVGYYVKYWNATKAYKKAYECDYNTARNNGSRLLAKASIKAEVVRVRDEITGDALLSKRVLIQKWIDIAFADMSDFVEFGKKEVPQFSESTGKPLVDKEGKQLVSTYSYVDLVESTEVDGTLITEVKQGRDGISIKLADKMKALDFLTKHMDLLDDRELTKLKVERERIAIRKESGEEQEVYEDDGFLDALKGTEVNWDE
ncbi:terminase small subunit [Viridibacillus arvi]|uniref:terminase small subunit n=1 Tax=Viridibacillus arvi TaxID=263475 RepID=UPI003D27A2A8